MGLDKPVQVTVALTRTESRFGAAMPEKITCVFNYVWDSENKYGRAYLSTINGEPFGAVGDDGSESKTFSGRPGWARSSQQQGGLSFEVAKFTLMVPADVKKAQAAIWVKKDDEEKLMYKSTSFT